MQDEFITRLRQADHSAIGDLYETYSGALFNIILRIVRSRDLAEQVLQDTFVKIWRNSDKYDQSKGRLFTWLMNIARYTAIDATRTAHFRNHSQTDNLEGLMNEPGNDLLNTDLVDVRKLIGQLDEKYRILIEMVYFQGFTQQELAQTYDIPIGTIKTRLRHAIIEMRKTFGHVVPEETVARVRSEAVLQHRN